MGDIKQFVSDARAKGLDDAGVQELLRANGWSETQSRAAVMGLDVPMPPSDSGQGPAAGRQQRAALPSRPSISPLQSALHHVLLWMFTITSSIMLGVVSAALFGSGPSSSEALLTYVVLEAVTFVPFALFFVSYLRQLGRVPDLTTGRVWSIITLVVHSVGLIGAVISFCLFAILVHTTETNAGLVASASMATMYALAVGAYVLANFVHRPGSGLRRKLLFVYPVLLFVLIGTFGVLALMRAGPAKADDQTRQNIIEAIRVVDGYVMDNKALPETSSQVAGLPGTVEYSRVSTKTYKLCASFRNSNVMPGELRSSNSVISDGSVGLYELMNEKSGRNCWTLRSARLSPSDEKAVPTDADQQETVPVRD